MPILFAYNVRADMPEDVVYKMVSGFYKNRDKLVQADPGFTPMAKDFVGMQVDRHQSQSGHPGASRPRQVPEGAQGLGRQVEGLQQRELMG